LTLFWGRDILAGSFSAHSTQDPAIHAPFISSETGGLSTICEHYERGIRAKLAGRYQEAARELNSCLDLDPTSADAHWQLGLVHGFVGKFEDSLSELRTAVELDGSHVKARIDLAMTYVMLGSLEEAKEQFQLVLEADPTNETALRQIVYL
jgi:tetratricopeptide (TPR) repeat protein